MASYSVNKVILIGNLTRDPELKYTAKGTAVANLGLATNRSWTTPQGETRNEAEFHNIVAWAKLAEICDQILSKGRKVYVSGRLQTRDWEGDDGKKRYKTEIVIDEMIALGGPAGEGAAAGQGDGSAKKADKKKKKKKKEKKGEEDVSPDDIPF